MSDAFLPGNGFDTYETQDKVLVSMDGSVDCGVVVRILQQQGFGVAGAVVQLAADQSAWAAAAPVSYTHLDVYKRQVLVSP